MKLHENKELFELAFNLLCHISYNLHTYDTRAKDIANGDVLITKRDDRLWSSLLCLASSAYS